MPEHWPRRLSDQSKHRLAAPDFCELRNDIADRLRRIDLVCARATEQRLDFGSVPEDERTFLSRPALTVSRPGLDTTEQHVDRRAQEDHRVEPRVETALIRDGSGHVKSRPVVA
jgi:hypothetical protein